MSNGNRITKHFEERRLTAFARPLIFKYFYADLQIKQRKDLIKGMSELLNNIIEKHYNSLPESDRQLLLNEFEKLNK